MTPRQPASGFTGWKAECKAGFIAIFMSILAFGSCGSAHAQEGLQVRAAEITALEREVAEREGKLGKSTKPDREGEMRLLLAMAKLANLYFLEDRIEESWPLSERVLKRLERLLGKDDPNLVATLEANAAALTAQGRNGEAEKLRRRALAINERAFGKDSLPVATSLQGISQLMRMQERYGESLEIGRRALEIAERRLPPDDTRLATFMAQVAAVQSSSGGHAEAEPLLRRALMLVERSKADNPGQLLLTMEILQNLGLSLHSRGQHQEAQQHIDKAIELASSSFGESHSMTAAMIMTLAVQLADRDQFDAAEALYNRALPISGKHGSIGLMLADNYSGLGIVAVKRKDWRRAHELLQRASRISIAHERATATVSSAREANRRAQRADTYLLQAVAAFRLAESGVADAAALRDDAFQIAQHAERSLVAGALAQLTARISKGPGALADLVRERQDLAREWQRLDKRLEAALASPSDQRNDAEEAQTKESLGKLSERLDAVDARLAKEFPDFAKLSDPLPVSIREVQALLGPKEVLVFIAPRPPQTLVWVIGRNEDRMILAQMGETELSGAIAKLRCGLDEAAWNENDGEMCRAATGVTWTPGEAAPPFDAAGAYRIYQALLEPADAVTRDASLIVVASGSLATLPLHVLVTQSPTEGQVTPWLARRNAIIHLPSVASLKVLRASPRAAGADRAYFAIANPLLDGPDERYEAAATAARAWNSCAAAIGAAPPQSAVALPRSLAARSAESSIMVDLLRSLAPLPETAVEVCRAASDLGGREGDVKLAAKATEGELKSLNASGALRKYRTLHFATHGALPGQLGTMSEAGLVLTPPASATAADDGFLTASEISELKLDADWIILSACNTAGAANVGAEALSGLARAFIFAGARSLLVSHWAVKSDATVKLVTRAVSEMAANPKLGRAEALRRAMLALIDSGTPHEGHPAYWAPFVSVGEGGAER